VKRARFDALELCVVASVADRSCKESSAVSTTDSASKLIGLAIAAAGLCAPALAQQGQLTDATITGHIYEPQRLPPTDARIESLSVPQGFQVRRFAEGLDNPRMLAVADDGTVYVAQRTPGNLVMLLDTDGDGIADQALLKAMQATCWRRAS
jgi:glucose/arabinose dehydrogenase